MLDNLEFVFVVTVLTETWIDNANIFCHSFNRNMDR